MKNILKNLKRKFTVLAVAMIAIQPVLVGGMMMPAKTFANIAGTDVVINEVQIAGAITAHDEFVELYNPTNSPVVMSGWRLSKRTSGGIVSNLVTVLNGTIPAKGYFLIASAEYTGSSTKDVLYSTSEHLVSGNTVSLYSDGGTTIVDKVGYGSATDFEGPVSVSNPVAGTSIERTNDGVDTDDNSTDFSSNPTPTPKNSDNVAPTFIVTPVVVGSGATTVNIEITSSEELKQRILAGADNVPAEVLACSDCGLKLVIEGNTYLVYDEGVGDGVKDNKYHFTYDLGGFVGKKTVGFTMSGTDLSGNPGTDSGSFEIDNVVLSPVVETPQATLAVATVAPTAPPVVQNDQYGGASEEGEVKADTTIKADDGSKNENKEDNKEDEKGKKNIPLWGIIFLLILAGVGGYLFYSQSPEKGNGKK